LVKRNWVTGNSLRDSASSLKSNFASSAIRQLFGLNAFYKKIRRTRFDSF